MAIFLMFFGQEHSSWRLMKEIFGIIIPIENVAHLTKDHFNYGDKILMKFLLDKLDYDISSPECNRIYSFIKD